MNKPHFEWNEAKDFENQEKPKTYVSSGLVIGEEARKFMSKKIHYSDEPLGKLVLVPDFLPSPGELALKEENIKITIALSKESVDYFKAEAGRHHVKYQRVIRQLLDLYVTQQKSLSDGSNEHN